MKNKFNITFAILFGIILIGRVSNWFLNFSEETNQILNTGMYTLLGIAYIVDGFVRNNKLRKVILILCGAYLIGMNFVGDFDIKSIIGTICLIIPMVIGLFIPEETDEIVLTKQ